MSLPAVNRKLILAPVLCALWLWYKFFVQSSNIGEPYFPRFITISNASCKSAIDAVNVKGGKYQKDLGHLFRTLPENFKSNHYPRNRYSDCNIEPWRNISHNKWTLFVIKSAPENRENRNLIRQTWLKFEHRKRFNYSAIFVIGETSDQATMYKIFAESQIYGDILQCQFQDGYEALPVKVLTAFQWAVEKDCDADFYSVTDDDVLVITPRVAEYFRFEEQNNQIPGKFYCGYVYDANAVPFRNERNKWYISTDLYSEKYYPTFCHGALWTINLSILRAITCVSQVTNFEGFILEDVLITGILREKMGLGEDFIVETVDKRKHSLEELLIVHLSSKQLPNFMPKNILKDWKSLEMLLGFNHSFSIPPLEML